MFWELKISSFPMDYYPDIFLKSARNICRAPPPQKSGRWKCTGEDDTFTAGVSCELECNEGFRPIGSKLNVSQNLSIFLSGIELLTKKRNFGQSRNFGSKQIKIWL